MEKTEKSERLACVFITLSLTVAFLGMAALAVLYYNRLSAGEMSAAVFSRDNANNGNVSGHSLVVNMEMSAMD